MKTLKYYYGEILQIKFFKQNGLKHHSFQLSEINNNNNHLNSLNDLILKKYLESI